MAEEIRPRGHGHGLGRGLSALIGDETAAIRGETPKNTRSLPTAFLRPNRFQPRKTFPAQELEDLTESIRAKGILQPILVRPVKGQADAFEIVAGERRWRAAQRAGVHEVPVVVREIADVEALEFAIIENVQRQDLNAVEEADAYRQLMETYNYTQEQLSKEVAKSRSHIANTLRLLTLPEPVKDMIRQGKLSAGHARSLVGNPNAVESARAIVEQGLSVRDAEHRSHKGRGRKTNKLIHKDPNITALQDSLSNGLGMKVEIVHKGTSSGELRIFYRTLEQLDYLVQNLKSRG